MSSMLEQAVVDADALREVAIKNAEATVIEKYAAQIKEAVETILEQPEEDPLAEDPLADPEEDAGGIDDLGGEADLDPALDDVPLGATEGESLCPCPEEEEEIEIDFDELLKQQDSEGGMESHEDAAEDVLGGGMAPLEEEIEIDEELLADLLEDLGIKEELEVDVTPQPDGWGNNGIPNARLAEKEEEALARASSTELEEENDELKKTKEELQEAFKTLQKKNNKLTETLSKHSDKFEKLGEVVTMLRDKLEESNLLNAKLLYTNKVLTNNSLNERQKAKFAEALSKSENVEETRVIYETLQSAVGSTNKKQPQSLSEAVSRGSSTSLPRRKSEKKVDNSAKNRWQMLAGINTKGE
jgi:hypothetical protein